MNFLRILFYPWVGFFIVILPLPWEVGIKIDVYILGTVCC